MIKAVFFDFDGTISDAKTIAEDSLALTLDEMGYKYDKKRAFELLGIRMRLILKGLNIKTQDIEKVRKIFYGHFIRMAEEGKISRCCTLKPLWEMKGGFPLVVVSNSDVSFLKASIKTLKIDGLFSGVYGAERNLEKDELLKKIFRKMKIKPSEAVYVGDRFSDVVFAKKAGCVSVGINNKCSWSTLKEIKKEKPDFIVKDFYGLRKVAGELNGNG